MFSTKIAQTVKLSSTKWPPEPKIETEDLTLVIISYKIY